VKKTASSPSWLENASRLPQVPGTPISGGPSVKAGRVYRRHKLHRKSLLTKASIASLALFAVGPVMVAGPAAAQNVVTTQQYLIGNGSVSSATAVAQPGTAGAKANYTIGFTTPSALSAGSSTITLADLSQSTTFPGSANDYFIIDNTSASGDQPVSSATVSAGGHMVVLGLSLSVPAGSSLAIYVIGAINPPSPGFYSLNISTSSNPTPASTNSYQIEAASSAPSFNPVATPALVGGSSTYTIGAFQAASSLAAGSLVQVSSSASATTDDNIGFPGAVTDYKVADLTTGTSSVPSAVSVTGVGSGLSGQVVTLTVATTIAAGDELSVTVNGVRNPTSTQADTISAAAPSGATPVTAVLQIGTSVTNPQVALSQSTAGATGVAYTVGFKLSSALPAGGQVTVVAPPGTSFSGARVTLVDVTHPQASADIATSAVTTAAVSPSSSNNKLTFSVPAAIGAGDQVFVSIEGVTNPAAGTYGGSAGNFTVATSADVIPAAASSYVIGAAPAPVLASVEISSTAPGVLATYTIGDLQLTASLAAGSSTVQLNGPGGTIFPGSASSYTIADLTHGSYTAHPVSVSGGGTNVVILRVGTNLAAGDFIDVVISGVVNPPSGTYSMTITGALTAAVPLTTAPPVPPKPTTSTTTTALFMSPNPAHVGVAVTYTATVQPAANAGTVEFTSDGTAVKGCSAQPVRNGRATCTATYWKGGNLAVEAYYTGAAGFSRSHSSIGTEVIAFPGTGYWLATRTGAVYGVGAAPSLGGVSVSSATGSIVGIASTPTGNGYWVATSNGTVMAFGDAKSYGDLPSQGVRARDVIAIAPTYDGHGYWLVGQDGGLFTFGDAAFHGSVPGLHLHVRDVVGMVASPDGGGYLLVGRDGGVFTFGSARFYGSLPGIHKHVRDIQAILPSSSGHGYVLVGADGGAFIFGKGVQFLGSLPGRGIKVHDIVGIALTPDNGGYFMAGSNGSVYGFGDAVPGPVPAGLGDNLPVVAIAGT